MIVFAEFPGAVTFLCAKKATKEPGPEDAKITQNDDIFFSNLTILSGQLVTTIIDV